MKCCSGPSRGGGDSGQRKIFGDYGALCSLLILFLPRSLAESEYRGSTFPSALEKTEAQKDVASL